VSGTIKSLIVRLAIGLLVCVGAATTLAAEPEAKDLKLKVGDKAPEFALRDREGRLVRLSDFAGGKRGSTNAGAYVLLDFFATDCKACRKELPKVVAIAKKHSDKMQVLLVALPEKEDGESKLEEFLSANPLPFQVLVDTYSSVAKKYVMRGDSVTIPAFFLIDSRGIVRKTVVGVSEDLEMVVAKILPPATAAP
jgi:peroxiredoxin